MSSVISTLQEIDISNISSIGKLTKSAITKVDGVLISEQGNWVQHYDNNDWAADVGWWSQFKWNSQAVNNDMVIELHVHSSFAAAYRPSQIRITVGGVSSVSQFYLYDGCDQSYIVKIEDGYNSRQVINLDWVTAPCNMDKLLLKNLNSSTMFTITNIEFNES